VVPITLSPSQVSNLASTSISAPPSLNLIGYSSKFVEDNAVFAWGDGGHGVLGQGGDYANIVEATPVTIASLQGKNVCYITCGWSHSAALTRKTSPSLLAHLTGYFAGTGDLYTWGEGAGGRLGHGDEEDRHEPQVISALRGTQIIQVACGFAHTVVLTGNTLYRLHLRFTYSSSNRKRRNLRVR